MPSGAKRRWSRKVAKSWPETISTTRAAVLMPVWQYCHLEPGLNWTGFATMRRIRSFKVLMLPDSCGLTSLKPELWVRQCLRVTTTSFPAASFSPLNSGRYFETGSSTESLPASCIIMTAVPVTGLVIEAIQKIESTFIGIVFPRSASPWAARWRISSGPATRVTEPAISFAAMALSMASLTAGRVWALAMERQVRRMMGFIWGIWGLRD